MISQLSISNYALIRDIKVELNSGLTIITGETGAGKSILLGALSLLLGKRADLSSAKDPSKKCIIEGEFQLKPYQLQSLFKQHGLDYDHHTIVRRELLPGGKSRAFVNDTPVTVAQLQALGPHLVDIHSQHETLTLSTASFQMDVIDALANHQESIENYQSALHQYKECQSELEDLLQHKADASKELDYNTFLYNELKEAQLDRLDQQQLEETYQQLSNAEEIQENLSLAIQSLNHDQMGALEMAKQARAAMSQLRSMTAQYDTFWERLNSCVIELEDLSESMEGASDSVEVNPMELAQINEQLQTLYRLQQKHTTSTVEELRQIRDTLEGKIDGTLDLDQRIADLDAQCSILKEKTRALALDIHENRMKAIPGLKQKLEAVLSELGLPNAQFKFELSGTDRFFTSGMDELQLLFTANKGSDFGLLRKVASGGEMSRIMMAVKAVLLRYKRLPTIIFDEIDTGVSGDIANKMAAIMEQMSHTTQLISITHLPQIAAKGIHHFKVYKQDIDQQTTTQMQPLTEADRVVEIAQMIGGKELTDSALAHARELLN